MPMTGSKHPSVIRSTHSTPGLVDSRQITCVSEKFSRTQGVICFEGSEPVTVCRTSSQTPVFSEHVKNKSC